MELFEIIPSNLFTILTSKNRETYVSALLVLRKSFKQNMMLDKDVLVGELHVMYENDDENYAIRGRRAYLFAFRVREDFQNKGYGTYLLKTVLTELKENGYCEFTVGVEDDNFRAIHMYQVLGFNDILLRKQEEYQGDAYEYNLYLKK